MPLPATNHARHVVSLQHLRLDRGCEVPQAFVRDSNRRRVCKGAVQGAVVRCKRAPIVPRSQGPSPDPGAAKSPPHPSHLHVSNWSIHDLNSSNACSPNLGALFLMHMRSRDRSCICLEVAVSHERCYPRGPRGEVVPLRIDGPPFAYLSLSQTLGSQSRFLVNPSPSLLAYIVHPLRMLVAAEVCLNAQPYVAAASRRPF